MKVRSLSIHVRGHLLITFEDRRCVLLRRTNAVSNYISNHNLYDISQPLLLNNVLESLVRECIFTSIHSTFDLSMVCLHMTKKHGYELAISKLILGENNVVQIVHTAGKKPILSEKGIL